MRKLSGASGSDRKKVAIANKNVRVDDVKKRGGKVYQRRKSCDWRHLCRRTTLAAGDVEEWWFGNWWQVVGDPN